MQVKYTFNKYNTSSAPHTNVEIHLDTDKEHLRPEVQRRLDELTDLLTVDRITIGASEQAQSKRKFAVGALIRIPWTGPSSTSNRGFRVWRIECECLGGLGQESVYGLVPLDQTAPNNQDGQPVQMMGNGCPRTPLRTIHP